MKPTLFFETKNKKTPKNRYGHRHAKQLYSSGFQPVSVEPKGFVALASGSDGGKKNI